MITDIKKIIKFCGVFMKDEVKAVHKNDPHELFELIWKNVESGIAIIDAETRLVLDVNPATVRMFGGKKEKIIGEPCYKFFGKRECPVLDLNIELARTEVEFIKSDGTIIPILKSASKIKYNGRPALLESFSDISTVKEAEEQKQALEIAERMQILLDTTPLCAHFWDKNLNVIDCNQESVKFFKMSSKQEYLARYRDLAPEFQPDGSRSRDRAPEYIKKAFKEGYHHFEWMRQMLDGELVPVDVTLVRVNYRGEDLIAAYSRDLREQKRMMSEIHAATAKLNAVIANYPGVIWSVDNKGIINLFNGLYLKRIGVTPSFIEGKNLDAARKKNRHLDIIDRVQKTMAEGPQDWISDIDGKKFHARTIPICDEGNRINGVVGSIDDVTEMIELQEKLKKENINTLEQFGMIWEKVDSGMMIIDCESRIVLNANPAAARLYGTESEKMIGEVCYKFFGQHECPIMDMNLTVDHEERKFIKLDGTVIPILKSVSRIMYNGKPALLESFSDISYMKEANNQKHNLEMGERMQIMLDVNPHINILFNSNFNIIDCNPAAINFMGFKSKQEMLSGFGKRLAESIPEILSNGRHSKPIADWFIIAAKEGAVRFETELVFGGSTKNINVELKKIPFENSFAIVAYVFDLTEIHEREMQLAHARELNELQLLKLNLAVKGTKIALWDMEIVSSDFVNPANTFIWSDEFRHMLGFSDENDFPNVFKSWMDRVHPDDKNAALDPFVEHLLDKTGKTPYDVEYRLLKKNGEYGYFRASGETIRDEKGNPVRVAGALMDITETKNLIMETERHRMEAEAANKAKSSFLSTMSHEIRTPMNAILGITEIQLQNEALSQNVKEAFDKIYVSGDMLLGIINDILDLSKIEAGKLELIIDNYEIASLISDTAQLNMMRIGSKPIEFELIMDENLPAMLSGDELRVKQILNNILSNAFKYTASGMVKLSVFFESNDNDSNNITLVFRVTDTGQGMSKEQVARLFDEYSRFNIEANRSTEGTGLGMGITRNLIRMMKGKIEIESEPDKGSTFTVYLPQGRVGSDILGRESAENLHQFRTHSRAQMKRVQIARDYMPYGSVLIVDDVETNIYVARGLLAPYGLRIESADSGYMAIEKIKNGNVYDVVFMDHMMPKKDGIETTKEIRELGYKQPIVALTANAVSGQADIFLGNGFDDFIAKPIDVRQLNSILNKLIRDKQPPEVIKAARNQAETRKVQSPEGPSNPFISPRFAEILVRDANKAIKALEVIKEKHGVYSDEDIRTHIINVHGMKSALANIGRMELSAAAMKLEVSGRSGDTAVIASELPVFIDSLRALVEELSPKNETESSDKEPDSAVTEDVSFLREKLSAIKASCEEYDEATIEKLLAELSEKTWAEPSKELLNSISEHLLHSDFDEIVNIINKYLESL